MPSLISRYEKFAIIALVIIVLIAAGVVLQINTVEVEEQANKVVDPANLFYRDLGIEFRDCGNEELIHGVGYNKQMRICFMDAFNSCTTAKLHQKLYTIEGDPIFTTLVIEGEAPRGCAVHIYIDSRDRYGSAGESDSICYSTTFDKSSGQDSFLFSDCDNSTQQYFY